jgi:prepilin-type N-terminal cleavage/methylation domain-containing protein
MRSRRGFSLIELLIVLSVGTAMLMVAMSVLYVLKETQVTMRQRLTEGRMVTRLADQFRDDVHSASRIEPVPGERPSPDQTVWQLAVGPDTVVRYEIGDGAVRRIRLSDTDKIQEDYRLPAGMNAAISGGEDDSALAILQFAAADPNVMQQRPIQIEAVLGFDNRHTAPSDRTTK